MDQPAEPWKRNRSILSCTYCRQSKSKCDREQPCSLCIKKGRAAQCTYPSPKNRKKPVANLQKRLRVLESMVKNMIEDEPETNATSTSDTASHEQSPHLDIQTQDGKSFTASTAQVIHQKSETRYIPSTHWSAILENVSRPRAKRFNC